MIPFVPFSAGEAAVVAHKFVLLLKNRVRRPIDMDKRCSLGHIDLVVKRDGEICAHLAKEGYEMQFGARSIARAVKETIEAEVMRKYYGRSELIEDDNNNGPLERYVVELHRDKDGEVIAVFQCRTEKDNHQLGGK